jgi:hypothetical protein
MRAVSLAVIAVLVLVAGAALGARRREPFRARDDSLRWARSPWLSELRARGPRLPVAPGRGSPWWFGTASGPYAGYAAPLELSLPLLNYAAYLRAFPPPARMPYNA